MNPPESLMRRDSIRTSSKYFPTSCPGKWIAKLLILIITSHNSVVSVKIDSKAMGLPDLSFHRTVFRYAKLDWDSFRSYMKENPLPIFFHVLSQNYYPSLLTDSFGNGMFYYPPKKEKKPSKTKQSDVVHSGIRCSHSSLEPLLQNLS